jgi:cytochrome P450
MTMSDTASACPFQDFDALAPETFDSPWAEYARLQRECPVAHSDAWGGFWALMRYRDVVSTAADYRAFTTTVQNVVPKVAFTGRRPPLHLDPPEHTPYRRALNPLLTEDKAARLGPMIRKIAGEMLDPLVAAGRADICTDFGSFLPVRVFAEWMNMPPDDALKLAEVGRAFNLAVQAKMDDVVKATSLQLYDIARGLIDERRANPRDPDMDPTSALLASRVDGQPLPDDLILGTIRQVLVVGIVAPMVIMGSICVHLSRHPDLQQQLRADPALIPAAIEEFLRLYTPYRGFARTAVNDVEIGGRAIPAGEPIALVYAAANRDPTIFEDPETFILNRPNIGEHVAFGVGAHRCAGSALARLELQIMLEELLARTSAFEVDGEILPTRFPEIGALSVPLRLEPRSA